MKFHLASDLHLEFGDMELPDPETTRDVNLILAGDIHVGDRAFQERVNAKTYVSPKSFMERVTSQYNRVIYLAGNHEFYGGRIDGVLRDLQEAADRFENLHFLENDFARIEQDGEEVYVLGSTLWTDLKGGDPMVGMNAEFCMNDYRKITVQSHGAYHKMRATDVVRMNAQSRAFYKKQLELLRGKKIVVASHHGPTAHGIDPKYMESKTENFAYVNTGLDEWFADFDFDVWVHGHTHYRYEAELYGKRILCNPRGYIGYEASAYTFEPLLFSV